MGQFWTLDGKVVLDAQGRPVWCDVCPCGSGAPCGCCNPGTTPLQRKVTVAGVSRLAADCDEVCDWFNQQHVLDQDGLDPCYWYVLSAEICAKPTYGKGWIEVALTCEESHATVTAKITRTGNADAQVFTKSIAGGTIDCSQPFGELAATLPYVVENCDFTDSTFTDDGPA